MSKSKKYILMAKKIGRTVKSAVILVSVFFACVFAPIISHAEEKESFSFTVMGCAHLGTCGFENYESDLQKIKESHPDFVVFLGGMIDPCGGQDIPALWERFDRLTEKLKVPVYDVPGICRLQMISSLSRNDKAMMRECFLKRYGRNYYSFEYAKNLFICLDTGELFNPGAKELDYLKDLLGKASRYRNIFIFLHGSPWTQNKTEEWFEYVHPVIKDTVKFVFGANLHYLDAKKVDGVTYITSGSPCFLDRILEKPSFPHFLTVQVDNDQVNINITATRNFPLKHLIYSLIDKEYSLSSLESWSREKEIIKPYLLEGNEREIFLQPDRVTGILNLKPGMKILDIGAGSGFFTFRFAEALKGTGSVFATETDQKMTEFIRQKAEKKYANVTAVKIKSEGLDHFYKEHTFDIIFLSETYHFLRHPDDYFRKLRPSLAPGGRLFIIHMKNVFNFTELEFPDFRRVIKIFVSEGPDFPVFKKLSPDIKEFIKGWKGGEIPPETKAGIVRDFNQTLLDTSLFYDLVDYYYEKNPNLNEGEWSAPLQFLADSEDLKLARWLFVELDRNGAFDKKRFGEQEKKMLSRLNRIMLTKMFDIYKILFLQGDASCLLYADKNKVISTLSSAGYAFVREYNILPYHYFLEFKRK